MCFKDVASRDADPPRNGRGAIEVVSINFNCSQATLHTIVTSIYSKEIQVNASNVCEIMAAADFLQVTFFLLYNDTVQHKIVRNCNIYPQDHFSGL